MKDSEAWFAVMLFSILSCLFLVSSASAQFTASDDAYTNTADPTTNYGSQTMLDVESPSQTTYIRFNLSLVPSGYRGSDVTQATLKLYVDAVTKAGSFNVDYVNGTWSESTIAADNAPALGTTIAASIPLTTADKNQYILINITVAVQAWLNGTANDGIALVGNSPLNASFDSKESTTKSHPAELDVVFAEGGTITGVITANTSGLTHGGASGTPNSLLLNTCGAEQGPDSSGSARACATPGGKIALSSITSPTTNTNIATGTFTTTFTEGDFGSSPVSSAFGITDTATSTTDNSFDLTIENGNNSFHNPFSAGVKKGGTYYPQLQICNNGSGHVGASLFGNSVTCGSLSTTPYDKVTITDNTGAHTGLAILNNASDETGTMLRLLSATRTSGSYNFLTACAGTTAADKICNGTIVAELTASGAFSVATSVTAKQFCIGSNCITSWPSGGMSAQVTPTMDTTEVPQLAAANTFTGNQTVRGSLSVTGVVTGSSIDIGNGETAPSNVFTIGQGAGQAIGDGWTTYSSRRGKTNIRQLHGALGMIEQLRGVSYDQKETGKREIGLIAEEVGTVVPEIVSYGENGKDARGVDYSRLTALLIEATKEQQAEFRQQQAELVKALRQIKQQQTLLRMQTSAMRRLEAEIHESRETLPRVKAQVAASQRSVMAAE
jgi:hypothetical protein